MLKQWIRRRKVSKLSVDPNDSRLRCPAEDDDEGDGVEGLNDEGLMASAEACYKAWKGHFETDAWRASAAESMRAVSAIYFHWAGLGHIWRPAEDVQFDAVVGISSSYQFFMLREGEVLARPHSCWCPACFDVATAGPGQDARLAPYAGYKVVGCTRAGSAFYEWSNKSCRAKTGGEAGSPDLRARTHGHALAAGILPVGGQWVLVEAYGDDKDELWLGKTLAFGGFNARSPRCSKKHTGQQANKFTARFNNGDYMVAVQWYERLCESGDGERLEFVMGERQVDVINSTELRLAGFALAPIGVLPAGVTDGIESASVIEEERVKWCLARGDEAEALTWCR
jgi:hypothetical protein